MADVVIGIGIDIGKALWNAYTRYRKEKKFFDLFRMIVKIMRLSNDDFAQKLFDDFIPHAIKNTKGKKKEEKIKRKIAKFCVSIPNAIKASNYEDVFPELIEKKRLLLLKLHEYENMDFEELKQKFSEKVKEIELEIKLPDETTLRDVDSKIESYVKSHPLIREFQEYPKKEESYNHQTFVKHVRNNFIHESGITMEFFTGDEYYIHNYITGTFNEIIPRNVNIKNVAGLRWDEEQEDY